MIEFFISYGWIIWLGLVLVFLTVEMFTLDLTFLMIAVGSFGGLASSLLDAPWVLQVVIAAVASALLIFSLRPPLLRRLRRRADPSQSNIAALVGIEGIVTSVVTAQGGLVKLENGETWSAKLSSSAPPLNLSSGAGIVIVAIEGATAIVAPNERTVL